MSFTVFITIFRYVSIHIDQTLKVKFWKKENNPESQNAHPVGKEGLSKINKFLILLSSIEASRFGRARLNLIILDWFIVSEKEPIKGVLHPGPYFWKLCVFSQKTIATSEKVSTGSD